MQYYDKYGNKIMLEDYSRLRNQPGYMQVGRHTSEDEKVLVSTVWLGLDHGYQDNGNPLIFETMIFKDVSPGSVYKRYTTLEEAEQGHKQAVRVYLGRDFFKTLPSVKRLNRWEAILREEDDRN